MQAIAILRNITFQFNSTCFGWYLFHALWTIQYLCVSLVLEWYSKITAHSWQIGPKKTCHLLNWVIKLVLNTNLFRSFVQSNFWSSTTKITSYKLNILRMLKLTRLMCYFVCLSSIIWCNIENACKVCIRVENLCNFVMQTIVSALFPLQWLHCSNYVRHSQIGNSESNFISADACGSSKHTVDVAIVQNLSAWNTQKFIHTKRETCT